MRIFEEIEELIRSIEPSMATRPIYLIDAGDYRVDDVPLGTLAYTSYLCDLQLAKQLSDRGKWFGPGFAAVFFMDRMPSTMRFIAGAALHEFAHWLTFPARKIDINDLVGISEACTYLSEHANTQDRLSLEDRPDWLRHESNFVRAASHLAYRAGKKRDDIKPWHLEYSQRYYGLCEVGWMRVLNDELLELEHVSIRDILDLNPPKDFQELNRLLTEWWSLDRQQQELRKTTSNAEGGTPSRDDG